MSDDFAISHAEFEADQKRLSDEAYSSLSASSVKYKESYVRLSTLQAWGKYILEGTFSPGAFTFFVEAQNDALISHLLARQGMWRPSLQSLRSCVENILVAHYYSQHPVELELWKLGEHKIGFAEMKTYFEAHPAFRSVNDVSILSLPDLKSEYAELSKAVHGSSSSFMMGNPDKVPNVFVSEPAQLGQWSTRQKKVLVALNLFMVVFHREKIIGTAYPSMRKSLSNIFSKTVSSKIKAELGVIVAY